MLLNLIITGSTGIIGRHVLYEYLAKYAEGRLQGKIVLPVRSDAANGKTSLQRIEELFTDVYRPDFIKQFNTTTLLRFVQVIDADLSQTCAGQFASFSNDEKYHIIHLAASTNLNPVSEDVRAEIESVNYNGTLRLFHATKQIAKKFVFVSTAFSSGMRAGMIGDDYFNLQQAPQFRNHYEEFKLKTEKEIAGLCKANNIEWQVLRPSIVCGRLLDAPYYATPKFNVFYAFGKFFKMLAEKGVAAPMRLHAHVQSSLNIVPVDYTAKAIVRAAVRNDIQQLNIVHSYGASIEFIMDSILQAVGYTNYIFTENQPEDVNAAETIYYKSAGLQFTPYITQPAHYFNTTTLRVLMHDIAEPSITENFDAIFGFAKAMGFEYGKAA
jgi:nucleoside-diphosphate-sugar epimerase